MFTVARRAAVDQWRRGQRSAGDQPLDERDLAGDATANEETITWMPC